MLVDDHKQEVVQFSEGKCLKTARIAVHVAKGNARAPSEIKLQQQNICLLNKVFC